MHTKNLPLTDAKFDQLSESKEPTYDVVDAAGSVNITPNPAYSGTDIVKITPNPAYGTSSTIKNDEDPAYL